VVFTCLPCLTCLICLTCLTCLSGLICLHYLFILNPSQLQILRPSLSFHSLRSCLGKSFESCLACLTCLTILVLLVSFVSLSLFTLNPSQLQILRQSLFFHSLQSYLGKKCISCLSCITCLTCLSCLTYLSCLLLSTRYDFQMIHNQLPCFGIK